MMTQKIPLPLKTESTLLLGLPVGDAAVAAGGLALATYCAVGSGWHAWSLAAGILAPTLGLLLRYQEEPIWHWGQKWGQYWLFSPRCFSAVVEGDDNGAVREGGDARAL